MNRRFLTKAFLIIFSLLLFIPVQSNAGYIGPEIPIAINQYDQQNPHVVYLSDKNLWFVVWEDWRNRTTTGADIYGKFINEFGQTCGNEIIISNGSGHQTVPRSAYRNGSLAGDEDSRLMIVWQDTRFSKTTNPTGTPPGTPPGGFVYYRTIDVSEINTSDCSGILMPAQMSINFQNDNLSGTQYLVSSRSFPKITYDLIEDRFVIVWIESKTTRKTINYKPFADFNYQTNLIYGDTLFPALAAINGNLSGYHTAPTIIIQWIDPTGTLNFTRANLTVALASPLKNERTYEFFDSVANIDVSCDNTSTECLLAWEARRATTNIIITCNDEDKDGICDAGDTLAIENTTTYDNPFAMIYAKHEKDIPLGINSLLISTGIAQAHKPSIGFDQVSKRFLVVWEDMRGGSNTKIFGQLVQSGSGIYNNNFIISYQDTDGDGKQDNNLLNSRQTNPFVSYDPVDQRFFVVWQDGRNSTLSLENLDIYGQKVDNEGSLRGYNYPVYNLPHNQLSPTIAYNDADDIFLVVWKDARDADKYTTNPQLCNNSARFGSIPCGSHVYGQLFTLGQPSLTLLNPDNTALAPPLLNKFQNPSGSGSVEVGLFATQSFKIKNTGDVVLKIDYIDLTCGGVNPDGISPFRFDGMPSQLSERGGATLDLVPSAEVTLTVRFTPTIDGSFNRCFIIESDGGMPQINLSALAIASDIEITPATSLASPYDFGNVYIGSHKEVVFIVKNNGLASLKINSVTNPNAPFTIHSNACTGKSISSGDTCNIVVRFIPTSAGIFNSQFTINSNDPDTPSAAIYLRGTGLGAQDITVTPLSIDFGNVQVGQNAQQTITIRNDGTAPLTINSINGITPPFVIISNNCPLSPSTLNIGISCQVTVRFSPTSTSSVSSAITIISNDPDEGTVIVTLTGTGVIIPDITASPSTLNFNTRPVDSITDLVLTISNSGAGNLIISSISNPSTPFSISANNCSGAVLTSGNSCQITVRFSPTTAGSFNSSVAITSNDPDTPTLVVNIFGTANIVPPDISVAPVFIDFGNLRIGTTSAPRTITVSNTGGSPLRISSVRYPGSPFRITQDTCNGNNIPSGGSCIINVVFNPTRVATFNPYYLIIYSNDPDTSQVTVTLSGRGIR